MDAGKVVDPPEQRAGITAIVDIFRANIIDVGKESMIVELTGNKSKLKRFIDLLDGYEILNGRTGIANGLSRGSDDIFYLSEDEEEFLILLHKQEEYTNGSKNLLSGRL